MQTQRKIRTKTNWTNLAGAASPLTNQLALAASVLSPPGVSVTDARQFIKSQLLPKLVYLSVIYYRLMRLRKGYCLLIVGRMVITTRSQPSIKGDGSQTPAPVSGSPHPSWDNLRDSSAHYAFI
ncbi:hypothetical protein J6590_061835 [Homalodisca vitripennis]|nr:hypothetical protein J6590_061835 [Homalodisca vitripennis]